LSNHDVQLTAWVGAGDLLHNVQELGLAVPVVAGVQRTDQPVPLLALRAE
jgi:hypothetical protein